MFRKRKEDNTVEFNIKDKDKTLSLTNTKDCCCSTQG